MRVNFNSMIFTVLTLLNYANLFNNDRAANKNKN